MSDGQPKRRASVFAAAFFSLQRRHDLRVAQIVGLVEQRIERRAFGGVVDARPAGSRSRLRWGLCRRDARGGDVRRRRRRSIFGLARSLFGEHGWGERDRGDGLRSRSRRVWVGEGLAFRRTVVDARDDSADLFDRLDARSGKRRQSRVLRVPIGADLGETGENRARRRSPRRRRGERAELRRIDRFNRAADRGRGRLSAPRPARAYP